MLLLENSSWTHTYDIYSLFPEGFNLQPIGLLPTFNFAPTEMSKQNLLIEEKDNQFFFYQAI